MKSTQRIVQALLLLLSPVVAFAHPGHGDSPTFMHGLLHPISGVDHLLTMIAVGIWAAQQGGRMRWLAPASFVAFMASGALLATTGILLPQVEMSIAVSIIALGAAIAFAFRAQPAIGAIILGVFAVSHGYAHGVEAHNLDGHYILGMVLATISLNITGIAAAIAIKRILGHRAVRWTGASIALGGLAMLVGA